MSRLILRQNATMLALLASILLAVTTSSLAQTFSSNTACTQNYVVVDGDTCDKIGQKTFTSTYQVMALNLPKAGTSCYTLEIGAVSRRCALVRKRDGVVLTTFVLVYRAGTVLGDLWERLPTGPSCDVNR
jgi:N-acetylglutamate synthase/N-acetylornithine aminotransferase